MSSMLDPIIEATRQRVTEAKARADLRELERRAAEHQPRGFRRALLEKSRSGVVVIAELKKASPSRGLIRADFHVETLARELEGAGATALSVLTDEKHFQGSLENLRRASATTKIPCLRKDFIVDGFQILEARAHCADAILLIVAVLEHDTLATLYARARAAGLDVLCEVHDEGELARAADVGCDLIGVNNRDLHNFTVELQTSVKLAPLMPTGVVRVAESGIHTRADIDELRGAGFHAFLIGESLMRHERPGVALRELIADAREQTPEARSEKRPS